MRPDWPYRLWLAALCVLLLLPFGAGLVGLGWELAQLMGLASTVSCLLLAGAPLRPRSAEPPTLLSLPVHTSLGWAALAAALLHIGGLAAADRRVLEYLKPTMPLYAWAGLLATMLLAALVLSARSSARRRLWHSNRGFQVTHVVASCVLVGLLALHAITTRRYVGSTARLAIYSAASMAAMLMLLRARRGGARASLAHWRERLVFGEQSMRVLGSMALVMVVLLALAGDGARAALREPVLARSATLPLDFPHEKHGRVNCLECHHNYADGTGLDWCIHCHRSGRADLKEGAEARFHGFCLQCHRHPAAALKGHGPVSGCSTCHRPPQHSRMASPAGAVSPQ